MSSTSGRVVRCCLRRSSTPTTPPSKAASAARTTSITKRSYFNTGGAGGGGSSSGSSSGSSGSSSFGSGGGCGGGGTFGSGSKSSYTGGGGSSSMFRNTNKSPYIKSGIGQRSYGGGGSGSEDSSKTTISNNDDLSYEYPLATEPPEIRRRTATEAEAELIDVDYIKKKGLPESVMTDIDPFDDNNTMTPSEKQDVLNAQRQYYQTLLSKPSDRISEITSEIPSNIPSNVPSSQLKTPETLITQLDNGIRVVSQETYGQVSTVGAVCDVGSRLETNEQQTNGVTNLLEGMAFGTTSKHNAMEITQLLQDWGGTSFCNTGREQSLYCIDLLRPNASKAMELLAETLLEAQYPLDEVQQSKQALEYMAMDIPPELLLSEALQAAAYGGPSQQLGRPHFCLQPAQIEHLTPDIVSKFWNSHFITNPHGIVVAGAGVKHEFLVTHSEKHFGHLVQQQDENRTPIIPSSYIGGQENVIFPTIDGLTRVAVALPTGGWESDDLVTTCVLQTLLGGGNSFSAGGPGKGMYSRLYRLVLNKYSWAESSEAFTAFYNESGLWGISGHTVPYKTREMVQVFCEHLLRLANEPVSDEELSRARNMLKCNVLTQLESRLVLFEDLARQVLTYNKREDMHTTCLKIDAVTKDDLMDLAQRSLSLASSSSSNNTTKPTVASVGNDLSHVPSHEEVSEWLCYK